MPERAPEWHLASLVVRHRPDAIGALAAAIAGADGLELALQDDTRSVLLQESDGTAGLMDNIGLIESVQGVYAVNLVYHHIEAQPPADAATATPPHAPRELPR